jgi:molecular chaperone DnaK
VKEALKSDDIDAIKKATEELESQMTELYNAAQQAQQAAAGGAAPDSGRPSRRREAESSEPRQAKGKVVDAEVVDDK